MVYAVDTRGRNIAAAALNFGHAVHAELLFAR